MLFAIRRVADKQDKFWRDVGCFSSHFSSHSLYRTFVDHGINQSVTHGFTGGHEEITVSIFLNAVEGLTGAVRQLCIQAIL